ncbi:AIR synthase related protein, partial [uncultured Campylobacter sp.]|uniref:AIR synthase related protein n=1 Tax=uncultured Campylobacter sp. TaxID=218934 RepID=UPI00261C323D
MNRLINETIFAAFDNEILRANNDSAILNLDAGVDFDRTAPSSALNSASSSGELAFSTDSFVVTPLFFNGGDIGKIAVCGTVNDLAMVGAKPLFLSCALIIEEGLSLSELRR